ncbi:sigma-70 family RNA polymerase sigma factor [uncultured Mucilaginibacter sp.]|uniref:RNA polymerase sigma factor n=1 Tax=uncultured Mucilaginibacter sp. TaxID=797541 RepID=UPI0025F14FD7|nr:sigma-70 family RNA polymerase sigma factor [uncultured Mucilaginibacter sp.]
MSKSTKQMPGIIEGCKANRRPEQEALYKFFYADMLKLCCRYLSTDELAYEALNTGFLKVFQNIDFYDEQKGELGAWIHTIMMHACIDLARKEARFNNVANTNDVIDEAFVEPAVLEKLYVDDVLLAIRTLPASTQLVFNLAVIEGYSHYDIGEQLNISESTSRWHLSVAKKQLRELLQPSNNQLNKPTEKSNKAT